ncbi:hypothetical protein O1M63_16555 [Streptomyces mirabilis]|nr:hypothetical protein [Streptomyces mirabilis]
MTVQSAAQLAFDGSSVDGSLFTSVTDFARDTPWLNTPIELWTNAGLGVFAVLMLMGWWNARRRDARSMALALAAPVAVVAAFAVAEVAKKLVAEVRPCYSLPHAYLVDACPARTDYAFPAATALPRSPPWRPCGSRPAPVRHRRRLAVLEGFTRVYVGAHYPHDVLGAALLALPVAYLASRLMSRLATPLVAHLRTGVLHPVIHRRSRRRPLRPLTSRPNRTGRLRPAPGVPADLADGPVEPPDRCHADTAAPTHRTRRLVNLRLSDD